MSQHSTSMREPGSGSRPSLHERLLALVVRPTAPPLWLGIVVAVLFITGETLLVYRLQEIAPENAFGALFLLGVLVVSAVMNRTATTMPSHSGGAVGRTTSASRRAYSDGREPDTGWPVDVEG